MDDGKVKISAIAILDKYLAERNLRRTPERYAILNMALKMGRHFHVDTLYEALEADCYHVSRATVYNTVALLVEANLLRQHRFANRQSQYEAIVDNVSSNHQHLICLSCGKVKEIKDPTIAKSLMDRRYQSFTPEYFTFYVYGTCSQCARRKKVEKGNISKLK